LLFDDLDLEGWRLGQLLHAFVGDLGQFDALPHLGYQSGVLELVTDIDLGLFGRRYVEQAAQVAKVLLVVDLTLFPDLENSQDFIFDALVAVGRK